MQENKKIGFFLSGFTSVILIGLVMLCIFIGIEMFRTHKGYYRKIPWGATWEEVSKKDKDAKEFGIAYTSITKKLEGVHLKTIGQVSYHFKEEGLESVNIGFKDDHLLDYPIAEEVIRGISDRYGQGQVSHTDGNMSYLWLTKTGYIKISFFADIVKVEYAKDGQG